MKQRTSLTTRNFSDLVKPTGNIYESTAIIAKRAKQIAIKMKEQLNDRLAEFVSQTENLLDETTENKEHIEISKFYEKQPKPTIVATEEFLAKKIRYHYPVEKSSET